MTKQVEVLTPSRLHFGLLGWGPELARQFGGVGLMVDAPGIHLLARPSDEWQAYGPHAARVLEIAQRVSDQLGPKTGLRAGFEILRAPPEHIGLGTGTQLSLAVAQCLWTLRGGRSIEPAHLAELTGRGHRSGIGLHGFARGGLIVDGGKKNPQSIPPLLAHQWLNPAWRVLLVMPRLGPGPHGGREEDAFRKLPPTAPAAADHLCRLVLLGLLPAAAEGDLSAFGAALSELQDQVGAMFSAAQEGRKLAHPLLESLARGLRELGFHGVGQSSWGSTLYAFTDDPRAHLDPRLGELTRQFGLGADEFIWTRPSQTGAQCLTS